MRKILKNLSLFEKCKEKNAKMIKKPVKNDQKVDKLMQISKKLKP